MARTGGGGGFRQSPAAVEGSQALKGLRVDMNGGARFVDPNDPPVFMGSARLRPSDIEGDAVKQRPRKGRKAPRSEALATFYSWDDEQRRQWGQYLVAVGRIEAEDVDNFDVLRKEWEEAVEDSSRFTVAGRDVSPWDVAKIRAASNGASGGFSGTKTHSRVDLTSAQDAKALVSSVLRDQLGRDPNPEELGEFIRVLNTAERANPVQETTTFVDGEATSTVSSGGLGQAGAAQVLIDQARAKPEYGGYQAATRLWNALMNDLIGAPV